MTAAPDATSPASQVGFARLQDGRINIAAACMAQQITNLDLAEALVFERKDLEGRIADLEAENARLRSAPGAVAWVIYAPNGNVRYWSANPVDAREKAEAWGLTATPLYAAPQSEPLPGGVVIPLDVAKDLAFVADLEDDDQSGLTTVMVALRLPRAVRDALSGKEQG